MLYHLMHRLKFKRFLAKPRGPSNIEGLLSGLQFFYSIERFDREEVNCITIRPKKDRVDISLFYLHGGAFVNGLHPLHLVFIRYLVDKLRCEVFIPRYPLAPAHNADDVFLKLEALYTSYALERRRRCIMLMGDSAGGNLALRLSQRFSRSPLLAPQAAVLLSPWLDLSMSNPEIMAVEKSDPVLGRQNLLKFARWYAGGLALDHPKISPLYGELSGLPPILLLTGSADILYPDAKRFCEMIKKADSELVFWEYEKMIHVWFFFDFFPETRESREVMLEFIRRTHTDWKNAMTRL